MARSRSRHARRASSLTRKVELREPYPRFLIVCEGAKTEPHYLNGFRATRRVALDIQPLNNNTTDLVREAIRIRDSDDCDQIWCVFDRDDWPEEHFTEALQLAAQEGINIAYSNQAFELWYLLHFDFVNTAVSRTHYADMLTKRLGWKYEKNNRKMFEALEKLQETAIKNARKLLSMYDPCVPARDDPSTTVHLLVEELNKYIR